MTRKIAQIISEQGVESALHEPYSSIRHHRLLGDVTSLDP
jgi:hypothetical protein